MRRPSTTLPRTVHRKKPRKPDMKDAQRDVPRRILGSSSLTSELNSQDTFVKARPTVDPLPGWASASFSGRNSGVTSELCCASLSMCDRLTLGTATYRGLDWDPIARRNKIESVFSSVFGHYATRNFPEPPGSSYCPA